MDLFFRRLHRFIFEVRPVFLQNQKAIKNYYLEFCRILLKMDMMRNYQKEIFEKTENYKLMKKLLLAETEEEVSEIGIFYNLDIKDEEMQLAKQSILMASRVQENN